MDIHIVDVGHIVSITENEDGTRTFEIPGMHIDPDSDEWVFDDEDNTAASGTGAGSTKPG